MLVAGWSSRPGSGTVDGSKAVHWARVTSKRATANPARPGADRGPGTISGTKAPPASTPKTPWSIAYEPIWAIGTGNTPKPKDVNTIHEFIKDVVQSASENNLRPHVLYGGSVNKSNAADFFVEKNIDGALVGGASLDADIFSDIIEIYSRHKEK